MQIQFDLGSSQAVDIEKLQAEAEALNTGPSTDGSPTVAASLLYSFSIYLAV